MIKFDLHALILRPIREVFEYISSPENNVNWQYGALESVKLSEGSMRVGTLFSSIGHFMGKRVFSTFKVIEYEPEVEYGFVTVSGPVQLHACYRFKAIEGGTNLVISSQIRTDRFFKLADPFVGKIAKQQFTEDISRLTELLEARENPHQ